MLHAVQTLAWYVGFVFVATPICSGIANLAVAPLLGVEPSSPTASLVMRILLLPAMLALIAAQRSLNENNRRAFVATLGDRPYTLAADLRAVLCAPGTWVEAAAFAAVMLGLAALGSTARAVLYVHIPMFALANPAVTVALHRKWAKGRIRK